MSFLRFQRKSAPHIVIRRVSQMTRSSAGNSFSHALKGIVASCLWSGSLDSVSVWFGTRVFNSSLTLDFHSGLTPRLRRVQQAVEHGLGMTGGSVPPLTVCASVSYACKKYHHNDLHAWVSNHDVWEKLQWTYTNDHLISIAISDESVDGVTRWNRCLASQINVFGQQSEKCSCGISLSCLCLTGEPWQQ